MDKYRLKTPKKKEFIQQNTASTKNGHTNILNRSTIPTFVNSATLSALRSNTQPHNHELAGYETRQFAADLESAGVMLHRLIPGCG